LKQEITRLNEGTTRISGRWISLTNEAKQVGCFFSVELIFIKEFPV